MKTILRMLRTLNKHPLTLLCFGLLLWCGWFLYSMNTAEERMTAVCQGIQPGMSFHELQAYATAHGLGPSPRHESAPLVYLAEGRSFGRHACRVELNNGQVIRSSYNFAD